MRVVSLLLLVLGSCASSPRRPPRAAAEPPATRKEVVDVLAALETNFYEHWGSVEARPELSRLRPAHVPHLRAIVDANEPLALMALRVLARVAPEERFAEDAKAILYVSALERERDFLRWGTIREGTLMAAVYGHELLSLGAASVPYLRKLLGDRRRAPASGEAERVNRRQQDRVCDYAWVFLAAILGRTIDYPEAPRDRDDPIRAFERSLDGK